MVAASADLVSGDGVHVDPANDGSDGASMGSGGDRCAHYFLFFRLLAEMSIYPPT